MVCLHAGDSDGVERLSQYMARGPFSLARLVRITASGHVVYRAEKDHCQKFPEPASADLLHGVRRNFQIFEPLDFLAELTQHIPNKGEHLIRYYGHYSNKPRGMRSRNAPESRGMGIPRSTGILPVSPTGVSPVEESTTESRQPQTQCSDRLARRRWAMLIQRVYNADPLLCPRCGGTMKIVAFIEAHQQDIIRKILEHCGRWQDPPPRGPPNLTCTLQPANQPPDLDSRLTHEVDPDFQEFARREEIEEPEPTWECATRFPGRKSFRTRSGRK
jgi:hypothetical protein